METKVANIARNTSYFTFALIVQKVISFSYFIIIARALPPEALGQYYLAISFTTIFGIFIDIGLSNILQREVPKNQEQAGKILGNVLAIKIPLGIAAAVFVAVLANLSGYSPLVIQLIYISIISMVLDSFTLSNFSTARGFHNLKYESISSIIFQLIVLVSGVIAMEAGLGLVWLMFGLAGASLFNFVYSCILLAYKLKIKIDIRFSKANIGTILKLALPFGLYAVSQRTYSYLDTVLLSYLAGDYAVGLYQVAFKIITAIQFLPMAFTASLYPAMSLYWKENRGQLGVTFTRALNYLIIISLPISIGTIFLSDKVVGLISPGYGEAILPLQISIAAVPFIFMAFPIGSLLNACDRQARNTWNIAIVLAVSVMLNLILIPRYHASGASLTVLATNALMFILGLRISFKSIEYDIRPVVMTSAKALAAGLLMGAGVWFAKTYLNIVLVVGLGGLLYFIGLYLLKGFSMADLQSIYASFKKC